VLGAFLVIVIMLARLANRRMGELPPWAPTLTLLKQRVIHRTEQQL
jgi:hypothetical protein